MNTDWYTVAGGDGFYTRQDPTDWAIVYGESQDGNMSRHDLRNGTQKSIRPNAGRTRRTRDRSRPMQCQRGCRPGHRAAGGGAGSCGAGSSRRPADAAVDAAAHPT